VAQPGLLHRAVAPHRSPYWGNAYRSAIGQPVSSGSASCQLGTEKKVDGENVVAEVGAVFGNLDLLIEVANLSSATAS
jgi:hypothetical protein